MLIARTEDALLAGRLETARELADETVSLHPDQSLGHVVRARVLLASGDSREAGAALQKALEADPDCISAWRLMGLALAGQGRFRRGGRGVPALERDRGPASGGERRMRRRCARCGRPR